MKAKNGGRRKYFVGMNVGGVEIIGDECPGNGRYLVRCRCGKEYESQITKPRIDKNLIMCRACRKKDKIMLRRKNLKAQNLEDQKIKFCYMLECARKACKRREEQPDISLAGLRDAWQAGFRDMVIVYAT